MEHTVESLVQRSGLERTHNDRDSRCGGLQLHEVSAAIARRYKCTYIIGRSVTSTKSVRGSIFPSHVCFPFFILILFSLSQSFDLKKKDQRASATLATAGDNTWSCAKLESTFNYFIPISFFFSFSFFFHRIAFYTDGRKLQSIQSRAASLTILYSARHGNPTGAIVKKRKSRETGAADGDRR